MGRRFQVEHHHEAWPTQLRCGHHPCRPPADLQPPRLQPVPLFICKVHAGRVCLPCQGSHPRRSADAANPSEPLTASCNNPHSSGFAPLVRETRRPHSSARRLQTGAQRPTRCQLLLSLLTLAWAAACTAPLTAIAPSNLDRKLWCACARVQLSKQQTQQGPGHWRSCAANLRPACGAKAQHHPLSTTHQRFTCRANGLGSTGSRHDHCWVSCQ
jgi:hypothetical protein